MRLHASAQCCSDHHDRLSRPGRERCRQRTSDSSPTTRPPSSGAARHPNKPWKTCGAETTAGSRRGRAEAGTAAEVPSDSSSNGWRSSNSARVLIERSFSKLIRCTHSFAKTSDRISMRMPSVLARRRKSGRRPPSSCSRRISRYSPRIHHFCMSKGVWRAFWSKNPRNRGGALASATLALRSSSSLPFSIRRPHCAAWLSSSVPTCNNEPPSQNKYISNPRWRSKTVL